MIEADHVVLGAGLAGAATAWRLAQSGRDVLLVEALEPATAAGSSHGSARIFRHAYPDDLHASLTVRALAGWRELEAASGEQLLTTTGGLDFGARRDLAGIERSLAALGLEHARYDSAEASERWPHLAFDGPVVHHSGAGVIDAAGAVRAMVRLAEQAGARVLMPWRASSIEEMASGARITSDTGETISCAIVVVCAGAWLPELGLPSAAAALLPQLEISQQNAFHFRFPDGPPADAGGWPIFVHKDALSVYSLPGGRDAGFAGFKIAEHDGGHRVTASRRDGLIDPAARERIIGYVRRMLPDVDPEPYAETTCLYTSTPSENFLIDRAGTVVVASPCSGHGAKFAPLLGELIADLATTGSGVPELFRADAHLSG